MIPADLIARVLALVDSSGAAAEPVPTQVPGLRAMRSRTPTHLAPQLYQPVFCLVLQGCKRAEIGDKSFSFGQGEALVVSLTMPALARIDSASAARPYVALALDLDTHLLAELIASMPAPPPRHARPGPAVATLAGDGDIIDAMRRLFALNDRPQAVAMLAPLVSREIHYWLLCSSHGAILADLARADGRAANIARAVARLRQDFAQPLTVPELARIAGLGLSAFHDHFRAITGTTPLNFQKQLRLAEARRLIRADGLAVSAAAYEVGYESPSQFSRDYSRRFGCPPSRDIGDDPVTRAAMTLLPGRR